MKGLRSTHWQLPNNPGDIKYSIGDLVNNIVIATTYGNRYVLEISGNTL